jgi:hypothetical protein
MAGWPADAPAELLALAREQERGGDQILDLWGLYEIALTSEQPDLADIYVSKADGVAWERLFADVLWIGHAPNRIVGYWRTDAATIAPILVVDDGGGVEVAAPTLVDYLALRHSGGTDEEDCSCDDIWPERCEECWPTDIIEFCEREGLPPPLRNDEEVRAAIEDVPDPQRLLEEYRAQARAQEQVDLAQRPLSRDPLVVALRDGSALAVSTQDDLGSPEANSRPMYRFEPARGRFEPQPAAPMSWTVTGRGLGTLVDGRAVVAVTGSTEWRCLLFNPDSGEWTQGQPLAAFAGSRVASCLLGDGRVLLAGGDVWSPSPRAAVYDPVADRWEPVGDLAVPRGDAQAVRVPGGALVFGGRSADHQVLQICERLDAAAGTWTTVEPPPTVDRPLALRDHRVLVIGHDLGGIYDPAVDAWTRLDWPGVVGRHPVELPDGRVALFGPVVPRDAPYAANTTVHLFDPVICAVTAAGNTLLPRGWLGHANGAAVLPDGNVLLVGGSLFANIACEPEIWDPVTGRGRPLPGLERALDRQLDNATRRLTG